MKAKVFVITPFGDDFLALYENLKEEFKEGFEFRNAGDLDNQQNILQDIVEGIYEADVIIADLTGLNANVFYELGLAHAMNKKVIIITQDVGELPFDIKSYRANEYSLQFNKLPKLKEELKKLLFGAIDDTIKYGNPVFDYIPSFYKNKTPSDYDRTEHPKTVTTEVSEPVQDEESPNEGGIFDYMVDIDENSEKITKEIEAISQEMDEMSEAVGNASEEMNRVKNQSGSMDANFVRNVCRKLATPVDIFANKLKGHVTEVLSCWDVVENSYLYLLDSKYAQECENLESINRSVGDLVEIQTAMKDSDKEIEAFISILSNSIGMERKLNKAITTLISELNSYLSMTLVMESSIDRILSKAEIVQSNLQNGN